MAEDIFSRLRAASDQITSLTSQQAALDRQSASAYTETGLDQAQLAKDQGNLALQTQGKIQNTATGWGVTPDKGGDVLYALGQEYQKNQQLRREAFDRYEQKQSVGFLQNPIQYLINQSTIDQDIDAFNNATVRADMAARQMQETNAAVQQGAKTALDVGTKVTTATIATNARIASAESTQKSLEAQRKALADQALGVEKVVQLDVQKQHLLFQFQERKDAEQRMKWARDQHVMAQEEFARKKQMWTAEDALSDLEFEKVQTGHLARTGQLIPDAVKPMVRAMLKSPKGPTGEFAQDYAIGGNVQGTPGSIAHSPSDLLRLSEQYGYNWRPGQEGLRQILQEGKDHLGKILREGKIEEIGPDGKKIMVPITSKDQEKLKYEFDRYVNSRVAQDFADASVTSASRPNLSRIPDLGAIVKMKPGIMAQQVNVDVLKPLLESGVNPDPNVVWGAYMSAVASGKANIYDAIAGYSQIYQSGVLLSQASQGLSVLGVIPPNAGRSYNYSFPGEAPLDRTDPQALLRRAARDLGKLSSSVGYTSERGPLMSLVDATKKDGGIFTDRAKSVIDPARNALTSGMTAINEALGGNSGR